MARVPTYDELGVESRALPGPQQSTVGADTFTVAARQSAMQTAAVDKAADAGLSIAAKMQEREDTDMVFRAEASFQDELLQFEAAARERRGEAAKGLTADAAKFFDDAREKYLKALGNDRQRLVFEERLTRTRASTLRSVSGHENQERTESFRKSNEAAIGRSIKRAAANAHDWAIVDLERKNVDSFIAARAAMEGWTKEQREEMLDKARGAFHTKVLQGINADPKTRGLAGKYFEKYKEDIPGDVQAELGVYARKASENSAVDETVAAVTKRFRPAKPADPIKWEDANKAIDEALKGTDPEVRARAKSMFRDNLEQYKKQLEAVESSQEAAFHKLQLSGKSVAQITATAEFKDLEAKDGLRAKRIVTSLLQFEQAKLSRAAAAANLEDATLRRSLAKADLEDRALVRNNYEVWVKSQNPEYLSKLTEAQAILLRNQLGDAEGARAYGRWVQFQNKPEKVFEAKLDNDMFQRIAISNGVRINEKAKSEEDKDRIVFLRAHVESVLADAANRMKRDLKPEEKEALAAKAVQDKVMTPGWFRDTAQPVGALTKDEQKTAYVDVAPEMLADVFRRGGLQPPATSVRVRLADVPPIERKKAEDALRSRGIVPTQDLVAAMWLGEKARLERDKQRRAAEQARGAAGTVGVSPANIPGP